MPPEALLRAIQMLGVDIGNVTTNLAMAKGQLDVITEAARGVDPRAWEKRMVGEGEQTTYECVIPPDQEAAIHRLLAAVGLG